MSLKADLERFRADFMANAAPDVRAAMAKADLELAASDLVARALKAGDAAPDFELPDTNGQTLRLSALLAKGPVAVSFYRGGWCPCCTLELLALQRALPDVRARGGALVAISPQRPAASRATADRNSLAYPVLSDAGNIVANAYGVTFDLAGELRPHFARLGHALPDINGDESWRLPIPATYIIDRDQTIALAFLDPDFKNRLEPDHLVAAIDILTRRRP